MYIIYYPKLRAGVLCTTLLVLVYYVLSEIPSWDNYVPSQIPSWDVIYHPKFRVGVLCTIGESSPHEFVEADIVLRRDYGQWSEYQGVGLLTESRGFQVGFKP